jgi:hypothetical protein
MRLLFIGSEKYDYLQDLTYAGLSNVLGRTSVVEARTALRYHLPLKKYPRNLGYEGLDLSFLMKPFLRGIDGVVVASAKPDCLHLYERLLPTLPSRVKTVFIDGGDMPKVGGDLERLGEPHLLQKVESLRPFQAVFKREYLKAGSYASKVHPFPFSVQRSHFKGIATTPYRYDVAFWAVESDPIRTKALDFLEHRFDCAANGTTRNQTFYTYRRKGRFYFEELKRTRISLNFRGTGWDCLRYWELLGLQCFMISQRLQIEIPNPLEEHREIVYCADDLSDLEELCTYYLTHEDERLAIARRAHTKMLEAHTVEHRARYLLERSGF